MSSLRVLVAMRFTQYFFKLCSRSRSRMFSFECLEAEASTSRAMRHSTHNRQYSSRQDTDNELSLSYRALTTASEARRRAAGFSRRTCRTRCAAASPAPKGRRDLLPSSGTTIVADAAALEAKLRRSAKGFCPVRVPSNVRLCPRGCTETAVYRKCKIYRSSASFTSGKKISSFGQSDNKDSGTSLAALAL